MARIRTIKPELAAHEGLFDLERETGLPIRFAWCMLFTVCDREGRFQWRPRTLKAQILPHDKLDFSRVLDAWGTRGFIVKYTVNGEVLGCIPTFGKHQVINNREAASDLPGPEKGFIAEQSLDACATSESTREPREADACPTREVHAQVEGRKEGKEGRTLTRATTPKANGHSRSPKVSLPPEFELDPQLEQYATDHLPGVDPKALIESFRGKAQAHDWRYANWRQAFQEFIRNASPTSGHFAAGQYPKAAGARQWQ